MYSTEVSLDARARATYERGRLWWAVRRAVPVGLVASLALLRCDQRVVCAGFVALLTVSLAGFLWRGQGWGHGARTGLLAGAAPFALPVAAQLTGHACAPALCFFLPAFCAAGGLAAGVLLGRRARGAQDGWSHATAAILVAAAAGATGCILAGTAGLAGMAVGFLAGGTVAALVPRSA